MHSLRTLAVGAATASFVLVGCAQTPVDHDAHHPDAVPAAVTGMPAGGGPGAAMSGMDEQIKSMQAMHERMAQAKTPEQRSALMAEHTAVMQQSMAMMGGAGAAGMMGGAGNCGMMGGAASGGMMGQGGMPGMNGNPGMGAGRGGMAGTPGMQGSPGNGRMQGNTNMHRQMMEQRMQMMQSMMQLMMDRMPPAAAKP